MIQNEATFITHTSINERESELSTKFTKLRICVVYYFTIIKLIDSKLVNIHKDLRSFS